MPGIVNLYFARSLYGTTNCLLQSLTSASLASSVGMVGLDGLTLNVYPRIITGQIGVATTTDSGIPGSDTFTFSLKQQGNLGATSLLGSATLTAATDSNGNVYYTGLLNLDVTALQTAIGSNASIQCTGEFEITDTNYIQRFQFPLTVFAPVYIGTEGAPTTGNPSYYTATQSDARYLQSNPTNGSFRIVTNSNGTFLQIYNQTTGLWHTISITGSAGNEQIAIDPGTT